MVHRGVYVGKEAVLLRRGLLPRGLGLLLGQSNPHQGLGALEAVFPRHHDPNRRSVLVRQHLSVHSDREERQRVHRLVQPQPFHVRPLDPPERGEARLLGGKLLGVLECRELDIAGLARRLDLLEQGGQRKADPRNHHRPGLHAPKRIDPLLQREAQDLLDVESFGLLDQPVHLDCPRTWL